MTELRCWKSLEKEREEGNTQGESKLHYTLKFFLKTSVLLTLVLASCAYIYDKFIYIFNRNSPYT